MYIKAYAKINLLLDIVSKLENGYHGIFSVMQSVGLCDDIEIERNTEGRIVLSCDDATVPQDERNTAYKAAEAFFDFYGITDRGISISLHKNIPHEAGLGGGSADAAGVIRGLCGLYEVEPEYFDLVKIGAKVGADVPFCLFGGTALCQNTGEVMSFLPGLPECSIVIVKPSSAVSTAGAYKLYDEAAEHIRHPDNMGMLHGILEGNIEKVCEKCDNVFEQVIEVCDRAYIKAVMRENGAKAACMSGSGSAVFGIFLNAEDAETSLKALKKINADLFLCKPVGNGYKNL